MKLKNTISMCEYEYFLRSFVLHSLRYGVFDGLDLAEQLMCSVVV